MSKDPSAFLSSPATPTQITALNFALQNVSGLRRSAVPDLIRHIPTVLMPDEMPELALAVEYKHVDGPLLLLTNRRFMFVRNSMWPFGKPRVSVFQCSDITSVEWSPGRARHKIVIHMGKTKEECYGIWGQKFESRKMAEHLASKAPGRSKSVAKDARTAKVHAIENMAHWIAQVDSGSAEMQQLPDILAEDEMPENLCDVLYDDRHGLDVSGVLNKFGLLVLTDRRLIFVHKHLGSRVEVHEFPYETIESVTFTKGLMLGSVSVWANGLEEKFDKMFSHSVDSWVNALEQKIGA